MTSYSHVYLFLPSPFRASSVLVSGQNEQLDPFCNIKKPLFYLVLRNLFKGMFHRTVLSALLFCRETNPGWF